MLKPQALENRINTEKKHDEDFMEHFNDVLKHYIANSAFSIEDIAKELGVSRTQLFRKIKHYYNVSPKDSLIKIRMQTAAELLQFEEASIMDVDILPFF